MSVLDDRTMSAWPLSIGTSLAFESLSDKDGEPYDSSREIPQRVDMSRYRQIWVNVSTLLRNMHSAVPTSDQDRIGIDDAVQVLAQEMATIDSIVASEASTQVKYYMSQYMVNISLTSKVQLRRPMTDKQTQYHKWQEKVLQKALEYISKDPSTKDRILVVPRRIDPLSRVRALMFTHMPYDLLAYTKFDELDLIESHTGALKKRNRWYTKYYNGIELSNIPFTEKMLKFFGDHVLFKPFPLKARQIVMTVAKEKKWSWATTEEKVLEDVSHIRDTLLATTIRGL